LNNLENLYRQVIIEHYKYPRNKGLKEEAGYKKLRLKNPSCGDDVTVQIHLQDGKLQDIRHDGSGCSICCSSASIMSELMKNKSTAEANALIQDYYKLIKGEEPQDMDALEEAQVFSGVAQFPARTKCATIAWRALDALINGSSEEDNDYEQS
jgi:SUF system NifU family Fe-S assembly protein